MNLNDLKISYGEYSITLNPRFVIKHNAEDNLPELRRLYLKKFKLYTEMSKTQDPAILKKLSEEVWKNEQLIVRNFNLPVNKDYFRFWELPKCSCPVMDNRDSWGTKNHFYNENCPIHGN